jgi:hypothetical protein
MRNENKMFLVYNLTWPVCGALAGLISGLRGRGRVGKFPAIKYNK